VNYHLRMLRECRMNGEDNVFTILVKLGLVGALAFSVGGCSYYAENAIEQADDDIAVISSNRFPLDEYLNLVWGTHLSQEEQIRALDEQHIRREDLISKCMNDLGFEYVPFPNNRTHSFNDDVSWQPNDYEWISRYGYGVALQPAGGPPGLHTLIGTMPGQPNPNLRIQNALSEAELAAYFRALHGNLSEMEGSNLSFTESFDYRGCTGWADRIIWEEQPSGLVASNEFAPLFDAVDRMREEFATTETLAEREWALCMANAGHPEFNRQHEPEEYFWSIINATREESWADGWDWELGSPNPYNSPVLAAFHEREVSTALADFNCRQAVDFDARQNEHRLAMETQFVNDHRSELAALRDAVEQLSR